MPPVLAANESPSPALGSSNNPGGRRIAVIESASEPFQGLPGLAGRKAGGGAGETAGPLAGAADGEGAGNGAIVLRPDSGNHVPEYPRQARIQGHEGTVRLEVFVRRDGSVGKVRLKSSSGYESLDRSARKTVQRWRFSIEEPAGEFHGVWVIVPVEFSLQTG